MNLAQALKESIVLVMCLNFFNSDATMITEATLQAGLLTKVLTVFAGICGAMQTDLEAARLSTHLKTLFTRLACAADVYSDEPALLSQAIPDLTSFLLQFLSQRQIWSEAVKETQEMKISAASVLNRVLTAYRDHRELPENKRAVEQLSGSVELALEFVMQAVKCAPDQSSQLECLKALKNVVDIFATQVTTTATLECILTFLPGMLTSGLGEQQQTILWIIALFSFRSIDNCKMVLSEPGLVSQITSIAERGSRQAAVEACFTLNDIVNCLTTHNCTEELTAFVNAEN